MKNMIKTCKGITDFCLILFITVSLCACTGNAGKGGREKGMPKKEHVYRFQEVTGQPGKPRKSFRQSAALPG